MGPTTPHHILAIDNAPFDDNSIDRLKRAKRPDDSQVEALKIPSYQRPRHIASRKRALRVGLELNIYQLLDRTVQIRKSTMSIHEHNWTETLIVQKSVTANFAKMLTLHGLCFAGMAHHTPANLTLIIRSVELTNVALRAIIGRSAPVDTRRRSQTNCFARLNDDLPEEAERAKNCKRPPRAIHRRRRRRVFCEGLPQTCRVSDCLKRYFLRLSDRFGRRAWC